MDEIYSLELALIDFIPNLAFLLGAFFLVRTVLLVRGKPCSRMCMAGAFLIFAGGLLKASWKLILTLDIANIQWMSDAQFILLAPGFLALLVTAVLLSRVQPYKAGAVVLAMAVWKIPLLAVMTISSLGAHGILAFIAFKRKSPLTGVLFIMSVLCMLSMAGMASGKEQTVAVQWIEEGVNSIGQIMFAAACWMFYKNFAQPLHLENAAQVA
jgi:hypothetical protein